MSKSLKVHCLFQYTACVWSTASSLWPSPSCQVRYILIVCMHLDFSHHESSTYYSNTVFNNPMQCTVNEYLSVGQLMFTTCTTYAFVWCCKLTISFFSQFNFLLWVIHKTNNNYMSFFCMANAWIQKFWSQLMDFHFFGCTIPELLAFCSETACSIMVMSIEGCFPFSVEFECVQPVIEESQQKQCGSNFTILMLMYFFKTKGIGHVFVLLLLSNLMWCCRVWRTLWEAELEWNYFLLIYT